MMSIAVHAAHRIAIVSLTSSNNLLFEVAGAAKSSVRQ